MKFPKIVGFPSNFFKTNFQGFWDSYNTTIHENEDISDVNKMAYLFGLLEGPAIQQSNGLQ